MICMIDGDECISKIMVDFIAGVIGEELDSFIIYEK